MGLLQRLGQKGVNIRRKSVTSFIHLVYNGHMRDRSWWQTHLHSESQASLNADGVISLRPLHRAIHNDKIQHRSFVVCCHFK